MDVAKISKVIEKAEDLTPSESSCLYLAGGLPQQKAQLPISCIVDYLEFSYSSQSQSTLR